MDVLRRTFFVFCVISVPEADYGCGLLSPAPLYLTHQKGLIVEDGLERVNGERMRRQSAYVSGPLF